jgi:hypothetical protein
MIKALYDITWDQGGALELVIATAGVSYMDEGLELPWGQQVDGNPRLRAPGLQSFGRGNVDGGVSFTVRKQHATAAAAANSIFDHMLALNARTFAARTLQVSLPGGRIFTLANAVIHTASTRILDRVMPITTATAWNITGSTWSEIIA